MTYNATMTQIPAKGGSNMRFEITDHPDNPSLDCFTRDFSSGAEILRCFEKWASQYGDVRLKK